MIDGQQRECLNQLGLNGRSPDGNHRFSGEDGRSLWNCPNVAGEMEITKVVQKLLGEQLPFPEILNVFLIKMQIFNIVDQLVQPRADGKAALIRYRPEKHIKICDSILIPRLKVSVSHRQLIKIAEHGHVQFLFGFHITPQNLSASGVAEIIITGRNGKAIAFLKKRQIFVN